MANFCLLPEKVNDFRQALKEKEIKIADLLNMTTEARIELLKTYAGDNAPQVNTLFEEKLILKNRMLGIKNWAAKMGEIGKYSKEGKAALDKSISEYRAAQQQRIFSPKENEAFLNSLANKQIGTGITQQEAGNIFELSKKAEELFKEFNQKTEKWSSEKAAADYGSAKVIYKKYIDSLKTPNTVKEILVNYGEEIKTLWETDKIKTAAKIIGDSVKTLSNTVVEAVASWDNSFIGRQGGLTLIKNPTAWWKMAKGSLEDFYKTLKGQTPEDVVMANVYSDPDYINGNYKKAGINFGIEEEVPTKILEKVPVAGRIFKASDVAFTDSAIRARQSLFKMYTKVYKATNTPIDDALLRDIGTQVNAITARGRVDKIGTSQPVKMLMWAPRMLKADWDILTAHTFGLGLETTVGKKMAAKTIFSVVVITAAITAIAKSMGADVETDPRSSDFLRIKVGNTRFNMPLIRGMPQIVTLAARVLTQESKSSTTGLISKLNTGEFGSKSLWDVGIDFLVNKTTPPARVVIDWARGKNFSGQKPTVLNTLFGILPISVQNFVQLKDQKTIEAAIGSFLDLFGEGSVTYNNKTDWNVNPGAELQQFKEKVGQDKFKQANDEFNQVFDQKFKQLQDRIQYKVLSDDNKQKAITQLRSDIKSQVFKKYNFKYKQPKTKPFKLPKL